MSGREVDRYRGSYLVLGEAGVRGGSGHPGPGLYDSRAPQRPMGPWQTPRLRGAHHFTRVPPPNVGFFYEGASPPLVGTPFFSIVPFHGPRGVAPTSSVPGWGPRWQRPGGSRDKDEVERLSRLALDPDATPAPPAREEDREGSLSPPSTNSSSSDAISVTSDDGGSSLPRIIKPRKRRKKDRKPPPPSSSPDEEVGAPKSIVTLRPYAPMCGRSREGSSSPTGCSQCSSPLLFPTPPSSPSLCSEDETVWGRGVPSVHPASGDPGTVVVRSYSAPHHPPPATPFVSGIRISSSLLSPLRLCPGTSPPRARHYSTPSRLSLPMVGRRKPLTKDEIKLLTDYAVRTPTPGEREWVPLSQLNRNRPTCAFTVMCYNVLCDKYATRQMYGYCPPWALEWTYRKKGIMDEIRRYAADIITLQEVETDQFFNYFLPELKKDGYDGIFSPKSRAKHMSESERKYVDGCAIFWRIRKFTLAKEHLIEFNQLAMANHDGSEDMLNRVMTKDNIGLAALLHTTEVAWGENLPDKSQFCQPILVCTAHIHWDPEFCDVKLIQTIMLMSEVRGIVNQIVEDSRTRGPTKLDFHDIHLMLCGDLNSLPDSGVVEFLTKSSVSMDHTDFKGLGYKTPLQKIALSKSHNAGLVNTAANIYTHSFRLAGTYDFSIMPYTNYTYEFKGIIDYIFHSRNGIRTLGVLGPVDPEWFGSNKVVGCPHPHIPSDHFPLLVELELQPPNSSHPNGLLHR